MSVNAVNHLHLAYLLSDGDDVTYKKASRSSPFHLMNTLSVCLFFTVICSVNDVTIHMRAFDNFSGILRNSVVAVE